MYFVIEIQILPNGNPNVLHFEYADKNKAHEKYHYVLAEAAVSECLTHTCLIMDKEGKIFMRESYTHAAAEVEE